MINMPKSIEIPILIVLIIVVGYFYFKGKKNLESSDNSDKTPANGRESENMPDKILITVKIEGMMCEKCAERVSSALEKFGSVKVNLAEKNAVIECGETPDTVEIENTVTQLGYTFNGIE